MSLESSYDPFGTPITIENKASETNAARKYEESLLSKADAARESEISKADAARESEINAKLEKNMAEARKAQKDGETKHQADTVEAHETMNKEMAARFG
jgi:hypothetical protein